MSVMSRYLNDVALNIIQKEIMKLVDEVTYTDVSLLYY
jgi:hypothetical protein